MIAIEEVKRILFLYKHNNIKFLRLSKSLNISRNTIKCYVSKFRRFEEQFPKLIHHPDRFISKINSIKKYSDRYLNTSNFFPELIDEINIRNSDLKTEWLKYRERNINPYSYSQFAFHFSNWVKKNAIKIERNHSISIKQISESDLKVLRKWRRSTDRRKWEKAVTIIDSYKGVPVSIIVTKIERSRRKINSWIKNYNINRLEGILNKKRKINNIIQKNIEEKKSNLIKLIHETPKIHGINRTSWSLKTLSEAYRKKYSMVISRSMISEYIRSEGYAFRKAKKTLTSPDPLYREKLEKITYILSNLKNKEKFFSVDEFGPFSIKIQGGYSLIKKGEVKTYPQWQKSKGSLICTAALELKTNQVTHFFSDKKNTVEMIKLLEVLLEKYNNEDKIFFSWDAASWHASKELMKKVNKINCEKFRNQNKTPIIELAPLPASAQFLNVIESVFSGMAKSIIHNSDYKTVEECKKAINLYFKKRNEDFIKNPKRAGNKIWGMEKVKPVFNEGNNCKDRTWR